jgi:aryl-alcohol dehydrogenase-like predicted oxidoreductase
MYKKIILGTAQFDIKYGINHKNRNICSSKIFKILNFLKKKNISFLDTASSYASSEEEIGKYFQKTNKKFKIITKFSFKSGDSIKKQFKKSFNLLGYLPDTILAHGYRDYMNPKFHEQIKNIKKKYLIKNVGVSLYNVQELTKILNYKKPDVIQVPINILNKSFLEKKIIKKLKKKSIKIIGRSIFLQGLFIIGVDSLSHLKNNLNSLNKKISKESYNKIKKINLVNNRITKPYLWKIKD